MNDSLRTGELVSELMDGRLHEHVFADAVEKVADTGQARELWHTYHLVGDVLRSGDLAPRVDDASFLLRFQQRLQQEVAVRPAPVEEFSPALPDSSRPTVVSEANGSGAANDAHVPWKWVAGLASLVVLAAASWNLLGNTPTVSSTPQLAQTDQTAAGTVLADTSNGAQLMIRDPRLDRLLLAHRQSGGQSALQVPSGFLRNATFEVSSPKDSRN